MGVTKIEKNGFTLEEFKRDYTDGISVKDLALKYGYNNSTALFPLIKKLNLQLKTNKWTKEQIQYLQENYNNEEWEILIENLKPFKKDDIIKKASNLNLTREYFWYSDEEINILKENYGKRDIKDIKQMLNNKSIQSIYVKANKLGLHMREKWDGEDISKLIKLYPLYTNEELLYYFPNRSLVSISSMATMKLNLKKEITRYSDEYKEKTKLSLVEKLIDFANEIGRTPTSDEVQLNGELPGIVSYYRYFGTYKQACLHAGLEVNTSIFGKSFHYISENGDVCLSSKELEITNLLIKSNIKYVKEVLYRDIIEDKSLQLIRCDWYIGNIVVEYFGMPEKSSYKKRMEMKINLCKEKNIPLISLLPKDLNKNYKGLLEKFKEYDIEIKL